MKKTIKATLLILSCLAVLSIIGFYRSVVDKTSFLVAFDAVLSGLTEGIWELLKSPIILSAIVIGIFLYALRDSLPKILSLVTEIKAGDFSAKIDSSKLGLDEIKQNLEDSPKTQTPPLASDSLKTIVNQLVPETCWYLLKVNQKDIPAGEHFDILAQETSIKDWNDNTGAAKTTGAAGYFLGLYNLQGVIFETQKGNGEHNLIITIKPEALHLIQKKLGIA